MIRRYLLDSGIAQDLQYDRNGVRNRFDQVQQLGHRIGICVPVLGELWSGIEGSIERKKAEDSLRQTLTNLIIWPYSIEAAKEYGRLFMELRRMGRLLPQIDIQIPAIANDLRNCTIVSKDTDFTAIPGVTLENWAEPSSRSA